MKTFGTLEFFPAKNQFIMSEVEPHVCIRLKSNFPRIAKSSEGPFKFPTDDLTCADLDWFCSRYPMAMTPGVRHALLNGADAYRKTIDRREEILTPDYVPADIRLRQGQQAREYQLVGAEFFRNVDRLLLGDDLGLGKSLTGLLPMLQPGKLPALVLMQTHMVAQWRDRVIGKFTHLTVHVIKGTKPYNLPQADVYLMKYSCLLGWTDFFRKEFWKYVLFDEIQELRTGTSGRYLAAKILSKKAKFTMGLSATPIYNYGDEIFNVLDLLKPGCLSDRESFLREWCVQRGSHHHVVDPKALGSYLREAHLFLRRTRADVGRELPPVNKIIHTVGFDEGVVRKSENHARQLAQQILTGTFEEKGQASRDLDRLARQVTGVSKAREVAQYVRILLEGGEPVILAGWHREVYKIWEEELAEFNPVFYTGAENEKQKEASRVAFVEGKTNLFIMSLRSGAGLDGLQARCRTVVFGELDWSPKVHDQLVGRADRDGQPSQVMVVYLVSESGSDPIIINVLGVKSSQSRGITDPLAAQEDQYGDDSRIKLLAQHYLARKGEPMAI